METPGQADMLDLQDAWKLLDHKFCTLPEIDQLLGRWCTPFARYQSHMGHTGQPYYT